MIVSSQKKTFRKTCSRIGLAAAVFLAAATVGYANRASANTLMAQYYLPRTNAGDGQNTNAVVGRADFTYLSPSSNGNMQVTIFNDSLPASANELISNIAFQVQNASGTPLTGTPTGPSGNPSDTADPYINGGTTEITSIGSTSLVTNSIAAGISTNLTFPWTVSFGTANGLSNAYSISSAAGSSSIGDDLGPAAAESNYADASANFIAGVAGSSPVMAGPVTFDFNIPGLTSSDIISNVNFGYGLGGQYASANPASVPAPEPTVLSLLAIGLAALSITRRGTKRA